MTNGQVYKDERERAIAFIEWCDYEMTTKDMTSIPKMYEHWLNGECLKSEKEIKLEQRRWMKAKFLG